MKLSRMPCAVCVGEMLHKSLGGRPTCIFCASVWTVPTQAAHVAYNVQRE